MMRAVIAIVVVLVVVAGFVVLQTKNGGEVAPQQPTVAAAEMPAKSLHPEVHVIDCGKPDVLED